MTEPTIKELREQAKLLGIKTARKSKEDIMAEIAASLSSTDEVSPEPVEEKPVIVETKAAAQKNSSVGEGGIYALIHNAYPSLNVEIQDGQVIVSGAKPWNVSFHVTTPERRMLEEVRKYINGRNGV